MAPNATSNQVWMDSRGTFMADEMSIAVYEHDPAAPLGKGALLAKYGTRAAQGGVWNLVNVYSFASGYKYYVQLTARRASGQVHSTGRVIGIN